MNSSNFRSRDEYFQILLARKMLIKLKLNTQIKEEDR